VTEILEKFNFFSIGPISAMRMTVLRSSVNHVHMLVSVPPKYSVSKFMGFLKGKSNPMIFDRHGNLKYKYGIGHLGHEGITWIP
jgi:REP element-mobilizing transposase RayT